MAKGPVYGSLSSFFSYLTGLLKSVKGLKYKCDQGFHHLPGEKPSILIDQRLMEVAVLEMSFMNGALLYILIISVIGSLLMMVDKGRAINGKSRISEKTLLTTGALGGAFVMLMVSRLIRHKTKKAKFTLGLPAMAIVHIAAVIFLFY